MIKINLLPPSIHAGRNRNIAIGVVAVLLAAEVGLLVMAQGKPREDNARYTARLQSADADLAKLQSVATAAGAVLQSEQNLAPKFNFISDLAKFNKAYPSLYRRIAGYTFAEVTILNLEADASQLKFDAYVSNPADVSRLLLGLSRSPDIQGLPVITNVPGYNEDEERQRQEAERTAERQNELPEAGSSIIGGVSGGQGDLPGGEGAYGAGAPGGAYGAGGPDGSFGGGGGNGPGGGIAASGFDSSTGGAMMGAGGNGPGGEGGPGLGSGGGGGSGDLSKLRIDAARRKPRGFTVTVTCALKNPVTRPSYGSSDAQAGAAGGGGGFGGMPGMDGGAYGGAGGNGPG